MIKKELVDIICEINTAATPDLLEMYSEEELGEYLDHLINLECEQEVLVG